MALWIALLLGIIQGLFMFIPVSSTAHLVIAQHWLIGAGHELPAPDSAEMILFDLVVHVGTLVSIVVVFWHSLIEFVRRILSDTWQWLSDRGHAPWHYLFLRLFLLCLFSVLVTGIIGLSFKFFFERFFANPLLVAGTLTLTGVLLWWTDRLRHLPIGLKKIRLGTAAWIGLAQGLSLVPGLSRSGMTITFALLAGVKRRWAAQYSFFLAIPTIMAATLVQSVEVITGDGLNGMSLAALGVGFITAAVVGIAALKLVLALLYRARLRVFSFYLWLLAAAVLFGFIDAGTF
ncbi:undecaprenyl-diphosphate phosphatase [Natronospira sp.]|uniref:undecaprenyl-diphosphate phosphatase n=1 Tax=Natronospira sp. TaxID=2024970 RepID=UPI0038730B16